MSRSYAVELSYTVGDQPRVVVLEPDLVSLAAGRRLPHVYKQVPPTLCLWLPAAKEWRPNLLIADTIVPWTVLWLMYFEDWLVTDEWSGGGVHVGDKEAA